MADDRVNSRSPERRTLLVSSGSSSNEPTSSGLQHFSLGRTTSPSNLFSLTVPVRLDVLYFLLNAARGARCVLPPAPIHDGAQASFSTCHGPPAQCAASCSSRPACCCVPGCAAVQQQPSGAQQCGAAPRGYGSHRGPNGGVPERQNEGHHWDGSTQRNGGKSSRSDYSHYTHAASGGWKRAQPHTGWRVSQRRGEEHGNGEHWRDKRQDLDRDWGNRRQGTVESSPWKSGPQGWRREGSSFRPSASSMKRNGERSCGQDAPEAKRCTFGAPESGHQKTQDIGDSASFVGKAVDAGLALEDGEDWEAEYEGEPAVAAATEGALDVSSQDDKPDSCKVSDDAVGECVTSAHPPKPELSISPLPGSEVKDQGAADAREEERAAVWSGKKDKFVSYLKNLYSDMPEKSSSEGEADLVMDVAVDPAKVDAEERSQENVAGSP